ncbi:occludin [Chanos chanos]|uniref:Occludin n=1 Tax=Chanos chanos TaxID=29144 RepID=A0A6J2UV08_CHACN|nr:occludin-like [Chanos chanos]
MSSKPNGSPPPYEFENGDNVQPQPAYSYYPEDEFLHFYRLTSPVGIIKIMCVIALVLSVAIFACVASTLAWDSPNAMTGFGGTYPGNQYGGVGGGGYYGNNYGGGMGGIGGGGYVGGAYPGTSYQNDPRQGKGFMIAMAVITFIAMMIVFVMVISRQSLTRSRKFYLAVIIVSAILAGLMLIATIVYLVAVNPMAQSSGSYQYNQIQLLCSQYQQPQTQGAFVNQYLYHYCVVDPQEAVAIVLGFLVTVALVIVMVFAIKTRQKMNRYGKENILWKRAKVVDDAEPNDAPQDVAAWVNDVASVPDPVLSDYPEKLRGSRQYLDDNSTDYDKAPYNHNPVEVDHSVPLNSAVPYASSSEMASSAGRPKKRRARRPRRADGQDYDTDYNSSGDELDDDSDFTQEFPPIISDREREDYKREFDRDHLEYKDLQMDLDEINKRLAEVDRELDDLPEGSPQYLDAMDEYNRLRAKKKTGDYQVKKRRCKYLKAKLSHIKKMVSDYDHRG